jgi:hypothetical protein
VTRRLACALVVAAACALSGCGSSGDEADAPAASGQEPAATATPEATKGSDRSYGY